MQLHSNWLWRVYVIELARDVAETIMSDASDFVDR